MSHQQNDMGTSSNEDQNVSPISNSGKPNLHLNIPSPNSIESSQQQDINGDGGNHAHPQQQQQQQQQQVVSTRETDAPAAVLGGDEDDGTTTLESGTIPNFFTALPASNIQQQQQQQPESQEHYQEQYNQQSNTRTAPTAAAATAPSHSLPHPQLPNVRSQHHPIHQPNQPQQQQQRHVPQQHSQPLQQHIQPAQQLRQAQSPGTQRGTIQIPIQPQPPAQRRPSASAPSTPKKVTTGTSSQQRTSNASGSAATSTSGSSSSNINNNYSQQQVASPSPSEKKRGKSRVTFQKARIKKIMQQDEEVGKIAAPVPILLSRCLELLIADMVRGTCNITKQKNAKTMSVAHFKECVESNEKFDFLKEKVQHIKVTQSESPSSPGADNLDDEPKTKKRRNSKSATGEPPKKRGRKKKEEPVSPPAASKAPVLPQQIPQSLPAQQAPLLFPVHQTANSALPLPRPSTFGTTPGGIALPSFAPTNGPQHSLPPPGLRTPPKVSLPPPINTGSNNNRVPPPNHVHIPTPIPSFSPNKQNMFPLPSVHNLGGLPNAVPSLQQMLNSQPSSSTGGSQQPDK